MPNLNISELRRKRQLESEMNNNVDFGEAML